MEEKKESEGGMSDENYINIQGWMINRLKLKGNELILYAIIYGFSQDGESEYYGSQRYISRAMKVSLPTANKLINRLVLKKLIQKTSESHYKVLKKVKHTVKETLTPSVKETLTPSVKETLTNNNNTNNNTNNNITLSTKIKKFDYVMVEKLKNYIINNNPLYQQKELKINKDKWANNIRLMREVDKLTEQQIEYLINWSQNDDFWKQNILSTAKLRKQAPKLILQAKSKMEDNKLNYVKL